MSSGGGFSELSLIGQEPVLSPSSGSFGLGGALEPGLPSFMGMAFPLSLPSLPSLAMNLANPIGPEEPEPLPGGMAPPEPSVEEEPADPSLAALNELFANAEELFPDLFGSP